MIRCAICSDECYCQFRGGVIGCAVGEIVQAYADICMNIRKCVVVSSIDRETVWAEWSCLWGERPAVAAVNNHMKELVLNTSACFLHGCASSREFDGEPMYYALYGR